MIVYLNRGSCAPRGWLRIEHFTHTSLEPYRVLTELKEVDEENALKMYLYLCLKRRNAHYILDTRMYMTKSTAELKKPHKKRWRQLLKDIGKCYGQNLMHYATIKGQNELLDYCEGLLRTPLYSLNDEEIMQLLKGSAPKGKDLTDALSIAQKLIDDEPWTYNLVAIEERIVLNKTDLPWLTLLYRSLWRSDVQSSLNVPNFSAAEKTS